MLWVLNFHGASNTKAVSFRFFIQRHALEQGTILKASVDIRKLQREQQRAKSLKTDRRREAGARQPALIYSEYRYLACAGWRWLEMEKMGCNEPWGLWLMWDHLYSYLWILFCAFVSMQNSYLKPQIDSCDTYMLIHRRAEWQMWLSWCVYSELRLNNALSSSFSSYYKQVSFLLYFQCLSFTFCERFWGDSLFKVAVSMALEVFLIFLSTARLWCALWNTFHSGMSCGLLCPGLILMSQWYVVKKLSLNRGT